jgi:hypothetical protein
MAGIVTIVDRLSLVLLGCPENYRNGLRVA